METMTPERAGERNKDEADGKRNRGLWVLVGVLAVAVVALGALLIFDDDGGSESPDLTAEQEQMLDTINGYLAAWNDGDGAAAASFMASPIAYHDNGSRRYAVRDGELEAYVDGLTGFSVRSSSTEGEAAFVGDVVMTTDFIPAGSSIERPSIFMMTPDGTAILWHFAP